MNTGNKKQDARSLKELQGVHPRLAKAIASFALNSPSPTFIITDGLRTEKEQAELVMRGASQTLHSKHLKGRAIDICILVNGKVRWEYELYKSFAKDFLHYAAEFHDLQLTWGGNRKRFKDGPHFELKDDVA